MPELRLPARAVVTDKRRAHIARVTELLDRWAVELALDSAEAQARHDAGRWHDALRDADAETLRRTAPDGATAGDPARPRRRRATRGRR